jgi:hypothetical protein
MPVRCNPAARISKWPPWLMRNTDFRQSFPEEVRCAYTFDGTCLTNARGNALLDVDFTFPRSYDIEEVREFPGSGKFDVPVFYVPRPKNRPEHDGLWLKIRSQTDKAWIGVFAFGYGIARVLSSPDPHCACVISTGAAYLVNSEQPEICEKLSITPVLDARSVAEHQLLLLADFTSLIAYGRSGIVWRSPRVCWDELKILKVTHDIVEGIGYDAINQGESRFAVDIRTGRSLLPSPTTIDGIPLW